MIPFDKKSVCEDLDMSRGF